jgi:hypothetical protein
MGIGEIIFLWSWGADDTICRSGNNHNSSVWILERARD